MSKPTIEAQIVEINDGPYFNVTLYDVPRLGEIIMQLGKPLVRPVRLEKL
jgi:hypothetical protein